MNVSHSIFTVPRTLNSKDDPNSTRLASRRPIKRSRSSSTQPPTTPHGASRSHGAKAARHSCDQLDVYPPWASIARSQTLPDNPSLELQQNDRATLTRESASHTGVSGQPPQKRVCSPTQARRTLSDLATENIQELEAGVLPGTRPRPSLPLRLSHPDDKPAMLGKGNKEESSKLKTLKLARSSLISTSSGRPRPARTPSGNGFPGSPTKIKTPDSETRIAGLKLLDQIGVSELLDQDDRPTFIIDLGSQSNLDLGPLKIIFTNTSLRSLGLLDVLKGNTDLSSPGLSATTAFNEFKSWATSYVKNHEALDVSLPSFSYAGTTWMCYTLRKRLRLIRGSSNIGSITIGRNSPALGLPAHNSMEIEEDRGHVSLLGYPPVTEPTDYFSIMRDSNSSRTPSTEPEKSLVETKKQIPRSPLAVTSRLDTNDLRTLPLRETAGSFVGQMKKSHASRANKVVETIASRERTKIPSPDQGFFDWTRLPISHAMPKHIQFARSIDWATTALGPIERWSSELRSMCNLIMASPHPAAMYWGEDLVAIYNEAYILLAGDKHPSLMGQSYRVAWAEIWDAVKDVFAAAVKTGQATMKDDDCLYIQRSANARTLEETYFSWSIIPLVGAAGTVVGLYNPAFEKTRRKIAERRMLTLRELGEKTAAAPELGSFWGQVLRALETNEQDTPFVLIYSISDEIESDTSSTKSNTSPAIKQCILEGTLGVPEGHKAVPKSVDLKGDAGFFAQVIREAMRTDQPILLRTEDGTLDARVIEGMGWRGFGDPCTAAVVCPIHIATGDSTIGVLVMGINPRRPYDDDYHLFVQLLTRQLATSMASVVLFEEEIARGRRAARIAALDRIELSEQLAARTQEAVESETRFTRMAELAPVGIFIADKTGRITYCNDTWYEISKIPRESQASDRWMEFVKDADKELVSVLWHRLVKCVEPFTTEFRFKAPWNDPMKNTADRWVLLSTHPEKNGDGSLKVIFGSLTDISKQKWAEHLEKRRVEEAVETKRLQDNFIDITSHEMRNPLSAILQCADEIASSLTEFQSDVDESQRTLTDLLDNAVDSAQTIALCASHQKRIVDDILTLSKLDSALLLVTPTDVMPVSVAQRALKMFDGEVQTADITLELKVDASMRILQIDWIRLDPSRLLQVLINLVTNSIKFTTTRDKRVITVTVGASLEKPVKQGLDHVSYFPTKSGRPDLTEAEEWGTGEKIYIHFAVKDTGRGLTEEETKRLFMRFSQASPRTHVQYGGSGLGLFISRELVELQGGEIGVSSQSGVGSTFAFYVRARRSTAPAEQLDQIPTPGSRKQSAGKGQMAAALKMAAKSKMAGKVPITAATMKVLLVEDNLINQKVLHKQLHNLGCMVYIANHGQECIDQLKKSTFWAGHGPNAFDITVILMDLEMPIMDGLTCAIEIRKLQEQRKITRHVPIIAVTANAREEQIETALQSGMVS